MRWTKNQHGVKSGVYVRRQSQMGAGMAKSGIGEMKTAQTARCSFKDFEQRRLGTNGKKDDL